MAAALGPGTGSLPPHCNNIMGDIHTIPPQCGAFLELEMPRVAISNLSSSGLSSKDNLPIDF